MAGVFSSFKSASILLKVVLILAFVDIILAWISFTTSSWARKFLNPVTQNDDYTGYGLWRRCDSGVGVVGACAQLDGTNIAYYGVVQAFVSIGFLGVNAMFFIVFLSIFSQVCSSVSDIHKVNGIQAIITSIIFLIGIIIFGAKYGNGVLLYTGGGVVRLGDLGYSFILAVFAMVIELVCGVLLLLTGIGVAPKS